MIRLIRTNSDNRDFRELVILLEAELEIRDGEDNIFYSQFNQIDKIRHVVVAYENEKPIGCGAMKEYDTNTMEVKRMFVSPGSRKKGIATKILIELENWASGLSYTKFILETGKRQPEAIGLYKLNGYRSIPNYDQYIGVDNSVCFEKELR